MKKILLFFLPLLLLLIPKDTFAQSITPTNFLIKNSNNTAVLYQSSSRDYFTSTPYYSGKFEINLGGTSVEYNASYGFDMYLTMYVGASSDYGNFGYANPELYINYNGLHQTSITLSSFTNTKGSCSNVVCPYQLHLSFTFATQYQGALYLALPYDIPYDTYGWTLNSLVLTNYGSNTSNSDIIANNNQNTQNIINNNNQNTQNINNHIDSIGNQIVDNTTLSDTDVQDYLDSLPPMGWGIISNIVTLPIYLLNVFISWFDQSCSSISLGSLYNKNITLACYDVSSKLGNVYTYIDVIFACFIYYNILMFIVGIYDSWTSFNDDFEGLYVGKHTPEGYSPRHGGGK